MQSRRPHFAQKKWIDIDGGRPGCSGQNQKAAGIFALRLAGFENL
jgi:hypothetical protein